METYSVEIVGLGAKGAMADAPGTGNEHKFLSYAHVCNEHPGFDIAGFVDVDGNKADNAEKLWRCSKNIPSIWIIASPDNSHYEVLKEAAEHYTLMVICEKPLCETIEQAQEIVELYKAKSISLLCDYTRRFIPYWQERQAEAQRAGEFLSGYCYYNRGALHTLSHFVDLALWFGADIDKIHVQEVPTDQRWVFQWGLFYENDFFSEHAVNFTKNPKVDSIYDRHLMYVMENAYNFLEGKEPLRCTGEDALKALEATYQIMGRNGK
jgi:hypothetical protein